MVLNSRENRAIWVWTVSETQRASLKIIRPKKDKTQTYNQWEQTLLHNSVADYVVRNSWSRLSVPRGASLTSDSCRRPPALILRPACHSLRPRRTSQSLPSPDRNGWLWGLLRQVGVIFYWWHIWVWKQCTTEMELLSGWAGRPKPCVCWVGQLPTFVLDRSLCGEALCLLVDGCAGKPCV